MSAEFTIPKARFEAFRLLTVFGKRPVTISESDVTDGVALNECRIYDPKRKVRCVQVADSVW
ncbi:hypothetical protein AR679_gp171 [Yellowstone lake phycodnavirus 1]|uniref:hypothetical protein n=1 Tax=Yellowstone lake phycodnavirus 1 TaxID=1586713 RepID=UPI0006EB67FD|nr:hypothetical protein AR679_gp171 [Yellowstone lake phycodnavirus 1]BAT22197.1 hypothetical protein [Yellowstone lake phycodnavirus 1]